ncbi:MAG: hypothetical protein BWY46_01033 [Firmicutes bacterium ADurb.Bin300]|nr:MAG: hypothetical protein BWY46_01033 [Firmicutes bacterium ADurb.Bin300]
MYIKIKYDVLKVDSLFSRVTTDNKCTLESGDYIKERPHEGLNLVCGL